jgi:nitroimidazol reductase NimA-like FMN-containing flavoprotein (pyridoxamine 5'-phosphate oxidase superfamily)
VSDRVAGRGLQQILPITYGMDRGSVYFRALPDCLLAELVEPTSVALEVDELNQQTRSGWSIVLHGHRSAVREPEELADLWASGSECHGRREPYPVHRHPSRRIAGRIVRRPT